MTKWFETVSDEELHSGEALGQALRVLDTRTRGALKKANLTSIQVIRDKGPEFVHTEIGGFHYRHVKKDLGFSDWPDQGILQTAQSWDNSLERGFRLDDSSQSTSAILAALRSVDINNMDELVDMSPEESVTQISKVVDFLLDGDIWNYINISLAIGRIRASSGSYDHHRTKVETFLPAFRNLVTEEAES